MQGDKAFTNRLVHETSPYLRQHAHNPVDWFPWGDEALRKAKALDRPIFLSIGYSACHWCHVMERESFEDPNVAKLLNDDFINIKVDREERPDLDQIYMASVQVLTQSGGWPMTVFLTHDLRPFYGGTYFPPRDLYGRPSFRRVVESIAQAWKNQREVVESTSRELTGHVQTLLDLETGAGDLGPQTLKQAGQVLRRRFDAQFGGFGQAPKFPHPMDLRLLLRVSLRFDDDDALAMVTKTLDQMARGGIYDQLGGGFHRYSTDSRWLVPHFEKMLYDNALLIVVYTEAFQVTGNPFYRQVATETSDYVLREMTRSDGPFFSTQDADSEGEEGKFFVWSADEVEQVLGKDDAEFFASIFDMTPGGNWEGVNIPNRARSDEQDARLLQTPEGNLQSRIAKVKAQLLEVRGRRVWPGRDEKILTGWNGLMITALAAAGRVFDRDDLLTASSRAADFVLSKMRTSDGRLRRTTFGDAEAKLNGYLEDYAYVIEGLVALYEATFEPRWLREASALADMMIDGFWDESAGGFFFTSRDHESLIARTKDPHDNATPSANAVAVTALLRLAALTGRSDLRGRAQRTIELFRGLLNRSPMAAAQMLIALDYHIGPAKEVALLGDPSHRDYEEAARWLRCEFMPHVVVAGIPTGRTAPACAADVGLLANRPSNGPLTAYVCQNGTCQAPVTNIAELEERLQSTNPRNRT